MPENLRKTRALLGGDRLGKWALLVVLALVAAVFEAVGALVVFALLRRITTEQSGFELPLAGNVREILPGVGDTTLLVIVGVVVAGFFVARAALLVAQSYLQSRVTENASADLAARLVAVYLGCRTLSSSSGTPPSSDATRSTPSSSTHATRSMPSGS